MIRWTLFYSTGAVQALYHKVAREHARDVTAVIRSLAENPTPDNMQVDDQDPSLYWVSAPGDHVIFYEVLDEQHAVRIVRIE